MGRLGVPLADLDALVEQLAEFRRVECEALMTHLASSDVAGARGFSRLQVERYGDALASSGTPRNRAALAPLANSASLHEFPEARGNLVRPGAVLYGLRRDILSPEGPRLDAGP